MFLQTIKKHLINAKAKLHAKNELRREKVRLYQEAYAEQERISMVEKAKREAVAKYAPKVKGEGVSKALKQLGEFMVGAPKEEVEEPRVSTRKLMKTKKARRVEAKPYKPVKHYQDQAELMDELSERERDFLNS